jgi:hypothetical protein
MHEEHDHAGESIWQVAWEVFSDPAHILAELGWTIIQDGLFVAVLYGIVFKKMILPKLRKDIHREIDEEHGFEH